MKEYNFEKDSIVLFKCNAMKEIGDTIERIFNLNEDILPYDKYSRILVKPNFNNDLNALTGNSTDLRIIISVLIELKRRGYTDVTLADGPNCGINHVGIDVFSRLSIDKIAIMFDVKISNLNNDEGKYVKLVKGSAEIAKSVLESDFIINLPKLKTHVEAGITVSCKNYIGCLKGTDKRKMHNSLAVNIVGLNEIIRTNMIIVDGLIGMEGRGPGDGIPKKVGVILSGHNPFIVDFLCSKLMGIDYLGVPFLKIAINKGHITKNDQEKLNKVGKIVSFKPAHKSIPDRILLNNFFIGIRFSKVFEKFFNKGPIPSILFKLKVKQDKYVFEEKNINRLYEKENISEQEKEIIKRCLEVYCPLGLKELGSQECIKCMYCYQIASDLIDYDGLLGSFEMQMERFGKTIAEFL